MSFTDLVIVIPGICGSELSRQGVVLWGQQLVAGTALSLGSNITALKLSPGANDGIVPTGLVRNVQLWPGLGSVGVLDRLREALLAIDGITPGESYFEFPYDWRRDNRIAAASLQALLDDKLSARRRRHPAAKAVLIVHSMGGLVARYCLDVLGEWKRVRTLITIGTPYLGSLDAVVALNNVIQLGPVNVTAVIRSFDSIYQLLPRFPCIHTDLGQPRRLLDIDLQLLPGLERERVAAGARFHGEIETHARRHRDDPEYYRTLALFSGLYPTRIEGFPLLGQLLAPPRLLAGDSVVPTLSAAPGEHATLRHGEPLLGLHPFLPNDPGALFQIRRALAPQSLPAALRTQEGHAYFSAFTAHRRLSSEGFEHLLEEAASEAVAVEEQRRPPPAALASGGVRGEEPAWSAGATPEALQSGPSLQLRVGTQVSTPRDTVQVAVERAAGAARELEVVVRCEGECTEVARVPLPADGSLHASLAIGPLAVGAYEVTVEGAESSYPLRELFLVLPEA